MTPAQFEKYYDKYYTKGKLIQRIARKYSLGDDELYKDLVQEGLTRLWELKPSRAKRNRDAWIRQAIKFAMVDYLRHHDPERYESLDSRLLSGEQLEQDSTSGELRLISSRQEVRLDREYRDHGNGRAEPAPPADEEAYDYE